MKVTETMIQAYFRDELGEYEQTLVEQYFRQHPELLESYFTEKSWEEFETSEDLASPVASRMYKAVSSATYKKSNIRRMVYRWTAAAAVMGIAIAGYLLLAGRTDKGSSTPVIAAKGPANVDQEWNTDSNGTGKDLRLALEDGSVVDLSEGSRIRYRKHFEGDGRNIWLTGTATFNVGKDKDRAFTVHTPGLDVTALGTIFKISASANEHDRKATEVRLFSGSIVVRPDSLLAAGGMKSVYLQPGQALRFDQQQRSMALMHPAANETVRPEHAARQLPALLTFNNKPLMDIMDTLHTIYGLKVICREGLLNEMTFTGSFDSKKETLESFLNTLSMLYGLTIKQEKNTITITQ